MLYILRKFAFFWLELYKLKKELLKQYFLAHHLKLCVIGLERQHRGRDLALLLQRPKFQVLSTHARSHSHV